MTSLSSSSSIFRKLHALSYFFSSLLQTAARRRIISAALLLFAQKETFERVFFFSNIESAIKSSFAFHANFVSFNYRFPTKESQDLILSAAIKIRVCP